MKPIIYQTFPRLFGNFNAAWVKNGGIEDNGCGKFNSYTDNALAEIRGLGATHVWYTGIIRHATCTAYDRYGLPRDHQAIVKGKAGSPYAIKDYYDVDPDLAVNVPERMREFEQLIRRTHEAGMKVIIDFVPNHVARSYHSDNLPAGVDDLGRRDRTAVAFMPSNNFYYLPGQRLELHFGAQEEDYEYSEFPAKATGNDCFSSAPCQNDWYETVKLNYGVDYMQGRTKHFTPVPDTWNKMLDILLFWSDKGVDGFRCDMAEMTPVEFWSWVIPRVKSRKPVVFIAEVYNPDAYRDYIREGKFDYLYDKVGMYDTMRRVVGRQSPASALAAAKQSTDDVAGNMLYFIENHDEQRIASDFFASAKSGIPAMACLALSGVNPVMIYNGQEVGERGMEEEGFSGRDGRTSIFDYACMDSIRRWANNGRFDGALLDDSERELRETYGKILRAASCEKAICDGLFFDLAYCNHFPSDGVSAFLRGCKGGRELILTLANFGDKDCDLRVNIPREAFDYLHLRDNAASIVKDLISGEENLAALTSVCPYCVCLPAYSAKILLFVYY